VVEDREQMDRDADALRDANDARLQIFGTDPDNPDNGRIFVLTNMGWFERIEDQSGAVAFTTIAQSESELREYISRDDPSADLVQLGGKYKEMVSEEFMEQLPQYRDSPEYSDEEPLEDDSQQYHQHDQ
jgi:hypothetical protein